MKKLIIILLLIPFRLLADDTSALRALFAAGNCTLISGHTYVISSTLTATHIVNGNGAILTSTAGSGAMILLSCGGQVINLKFQGTFTNPVSPINPSANYAISINCDNAIIQNCLFQNFAGYAIVCKAFNNPTVTGCTFTQIGYIPFFYDSEATKVGGTFSSNFIDRSMLPASTVQQNSITIRASTSNPAFQITGWVIAGNTVKMPTNPVSTTAECMETRYCNSSTISNNIMTGGSIGISVVRSNNVNLSGNKCTGQNQEGIEFADSFSSISTGDKSFQTNASQGAMLLDGAVGCNHIIITADSLSNGGTLDGLHCYLNTTYVYLTGTTITTNGKGVDAQQTNFIFSTASTINGNAGSIAYYLNNCPGNLTINQGTINQALYGVYSVTATADNVYGYCVTLTSVANQFGGTFTSNKGFLPNGCYISRNVKVVVLT